MNKGYSITQTLAFKQTTILAPQLQQGVRLLALSSMDLQNEVELALESNPFLEKLDYETGIEARSAISDPRLRQKPPKHRESSVIQAYTPIVASTSASSSAKGTTPGKHPDHSFSASANMVTEREREQNLSEYLHHQARTTPLSDKQHYILELLIDSVNDNGYLRARVDEIVQFAMPEYIVKRQEVIAMIRVLQDFEPVGVGARTPRECLQIQLNEYSEETPGLFIARQIIENYLPLLAAKSYSQISEKLKLKEAQLKQAIALIRQLDPFPGARISVFEETTIAPDLLLKKIEGKWVVRLNPNIAPAIVIHDESAQLLKLAKGQPGYERLKQELQAAQGLLSNLQRRYYTIYQIAKIIVERQNEFLDKGQIALKPLAQKEIAERLEIHVSTVSRAVNGKYILTPFGVLELRYFFSNAIPAKGGKHTSSRAIQALIKKIIDAEPPEKPLSDNIISTILEQQGFHVARRTVMKYRELLEIPPSPKRRKGNREIGK